MRWEYKVLELKTGRAFWTGKLKPEDIEYDLNNLGREGWELVNITVNPMHQMVAVFKRAK